MMKKGLLCLLTLTILNTLAFSQDTTQTFSAGANSLNLVFVNIGNPGNKNDVNCTLEGRYPINTVGTVSYKYRISKYEITRDNITKANAAAPFAITLEDMSFGVGGNGPNKPATGISWNEAARFVNYLNTKKGFPPAYKFSGASINENIQLWQSTDVGYDPENPYRNKNAKFFLPSISEWHKAAYYDPVADKYYLYPTGSDSAPTPVSEGTSPGTAVFAQGWTTPADVDKAGGLSPYGTMGQGGNVSEWLENAFYSPGPLNNNDPLKNRAVKGDDFKNFQRYMGSDAIDNYIATNESQLRGFRVASTAELFFEITPTTTLPTIASNVALGSSISVSSTYEDNVTNFGPLKLIDGSTSETPNSFWLAKGTGDSIAGTMPAWIIFDLRRAYELGTISILNAKNSPFNDRGAKNFYISTSPDGITFETVSGVKTLDWQNTSFQSYQFPSSIVARYVKITLQDANGGAVGLNEVRIYPAPSALYALTRIHDNTMGSLSAEPDLATYEANSIVSLTASPKPGFRLNSWSGDGTGSSSTITITMNSDKTISANFGQDTGDNDSDGLSNYQETVTYETNPNQKDTNTDGIEDGQAVTLGYSPTFNFSALISHLQSHPPTGLYTASQMQTMAIGDLVLTKNPDGSFVLNYDIEQSTDLQSWSLYQSFDHTLNDLPPDKAFIRIRAKQ
jgi:formylglycine-generating enzyme